MNKSEQIVEALARHGVTYCGAVPGGGIMYLVDAFGSHEDMRVRFYHHEQAAGLGAEGYARVESWPAVCLATIGPGAMNAVSAAYSAFINSTPVLFITGAKRSTFTTDYQRQRFNFPQDGDTTGVATPTVKRYHLLSADDDVEQVVHELLELAVQGRPGPVWLDIPLDVQALAAEESDALPVAGEAATSGSTTAEVVSALASTLESAERPVLVLGRGCEPVLRDESFQGFLRALGLPCMTAIGSNHMISGVGDLGLGFFGPAGRRAANRVLVESDVVIALGAGLDIDQTGFNREAFFAGKRMLTINSDPYLALAEAGEWKAVVASTRDIDFDAASAELESFSERFASWREFATKVNALLSVEREIEQNLTADGVDPYAFCRGFAELLPASTGIAGGIGLDVSALSHVIELRPGQEFYLSAHAGQLGWDLPAAVGIADSGRFDTLVCLTGDGSIMFNLQELGTLQVSHEHVVVVVFDNDGYNSIRISQDTHLGGRRYGSDRTSLAFPHWDVLAEAFGYQYLEVASNDEIGTIEQTLAGGHWLVRVVTHPNRTRTPRIVSKLKDGVFQSPSLFEQFPDLPEDVEQAYSALAATLKP